MKNEKISFKKHIHYVFRFTVMYSKIIKMLKKQQHAFENNTLIMCVLVVVNISIPHVASSCGRFSLLI